MSELVQDATCEKIAGSRAMPWTERSQENDVPWNRLQKRECPTKRRSLIQQTVQDHVTQSWFVFVDKNDGTSTAENASFVKTSARTAVPGLADTEVLHIVGKPLRPVQAVFGSEVLD